MVIGALGSLIVEIVNKGDRATALQWIGACLLYTALTFRNIRQKEGTIIYMEEWLRKCLDCYHCYTSKNDDLEVRCKRADKGKGCRFYSEDEHTNRLNRKKR